MIGPFADIAETHISTVFFAGERAYKLLKPVKMAFLDFSTAALRLEAVTRELQLNQRIAPDVYLGFADVFEGGTIVDRMMVMRRLPGSRRLSRLLTEPGHEPQLRRVARTVAQFHAALPALRDTPSPAQMEAVLGNWEDNADSMKPFAGSVLDADDLDRVVDLYRAYLLPREALFEQRIAAGLVRDGHGDLTAEDIFCLDDGPRILDCLAFDDSLRISDVLLDVAFLAMDVERIAGESSADVFMKAYTEFSNEHHPDSLLHHYVAYRAQVRAKVACLRYEQGDSPSGALAATYLTQCLGHLERSAVKLVLIGGAPGTGKTTLANALGAKRRWIVLNSDELRKDVAGRAHRQTEVAPFGEGIYTEEFNQKTYDTLVEQARRLLQNGETVVLDASWPSQELRAMARRVAEEAGATSYEIECQLSAEECRQRISDRLLDPDRDDFSDATPAMVEQAIAVREPWPEAQAVQSSLPVSELVEEVAQMFDSAARK